MLQRRSTTRQCYICFKKFTTKPTQQTKCCSDECKEKYDHRFETEEEDGTQDEIEMD